MVRPGFVQPDFTAPVNLASQKTLVQPGATVKGMQLAALVTECHKRGAPIEGRRYVAYRDYPGEELLDLLVLASGRAWPGVPCREGLRRLGRVAYPTLHGSLIGRVVFSALGSDIHGVWRLVSKGYSLSGSHGTAETVELTDTDVVIRLEGIYTFVESWHVGIIEGAVEIYGFVPDVRLRQISPTSAEFWVRWSPKEAGPAESKRG